MKEDKEVELQRRYYAATAQQYNNMHGRYDERPEHFLALSFMVAALDYLGIQSILDVGSGTGRAINYLNRKRPDLRVIGIEPVLELRQIGHGEGIAVDKLIDGDATNLAFANDEFDLVCAFGLLHHVRRPQKVISEMLRVAKTAILISDSNNFGQGSAIVRLVKQLINAVGLWNVANFIKTKGKGYVISDGDGLAYSYSVFNNYEQIKRECSEVHCLNTNGGGLNLYRTADHIALLGIKRRASKHPTKL